MFMPQVNALVAWIDGSQLGTPQRAGKYEEFFKPPVDYYDYVIGRLRIAISDGNVVAFGKGNHDHFLKSAA
jgi:hypothetical protein